MSKAENASRLRTFSRDLRQYLRRRYMSSRLKRQARKRPLRIVLGSGEVPVPGWVLTDIDQLNVLQAGDWEAYFSADSVDAILAEHVWEHFSAEDAVTAAGLCWKYLCPGGRLRVAVPDGYHPDEDYRAAVAPGGSGPGAMDHQVLYTWITLRTVFERAGFEVALLEYFDEQGRFHAAAWDPEDGKIRRSARFDPRNRQGVLRYTSIILDAIKPVGSIEACKQ